MGTDKADGVESVPVPVKSRYRVVIPGEVRSFVAREDGEVRYAFHPQTNCPYLERTGGDQAFPTKVHQYVPLDRWRFVVPNQIALTLRLGGSKWLVFRVDQFGIRLLRVDWPNRGLPEDAHLVRARPDGSLLVPKRQAQKLGIGPGELAVLQARGSRCVVEKARYHIDESHPPRVSPG